MSNKKKKAKKISAKKEKYAKFRKEKSTKMDLTMPDLTEEQQKWKLEDEQSINKHMRFNKNRPTKSTMEKIRGKKTK